MKDWEKISIAPDGTHHQVEGTPLYSQRFLSVLPFHAPGLAPVVDRTGAYHIGRDGQPVYRHRFSRTFGFYEGKASVSHRETGWFHIFPNGEPVYPERYDWCGNYQNGFATVRDQNREYFHLDANGRCAYSGSWRYAGDFREGSAVVQNSEGLHSHIDVEGILIHRQWFSDLDVFHKGFARAEDEGGWHHIDQSGNPVYKKRFARIEPFYNGQARVTTLNDALLVIDELGNTLAQLCPSREDSFHALSADLVGYWKSYTILSAVELGVFNCLPASLEAIAENTRLSSASTKRLLRALQELGLVESGDESELFSVTERGHFLKDDVRYSLASAARTWVATHTSNWETLTRSLMTGEPSSRREWFEQLARDEGAVRTYQNALSSYAEYDYREIPQRIDWAHHGVLIDAGGGQGMLLKQILSAYPDLKGILLERAEVVDQLEIPDPLQERLKARAFDLFQNWGVEGDAVILARVLHDWNDEKVMMILRQAYHALKQGGTLYIVEFLLTPNQGSGGLLDLNMLVTTGGKERSQQEFRNLLFESGFELETVYPLNRISHILIGKKYQKT